MNSKKCLLIIDAQVGMFNLPVPMYKSNILLKNIKQLIQKAKSSNMPVIYLRHNGSENSPFKKDSTGWEIHPEIKPDENDYIIEKIFSDSFQNTELNKVLKELNINNLVICGFVTEGCIDTTTMRAFSLGYKIELASDCHSTTDSKNLKAEQIIKHHNEVLKIFSDVKESQEITFQ